MTYNNEQFFSKDKVFPNERRFILLLRCLVGTLGVYAYYFAFMVRFFHFEIE